VVTFEHYIPRWNVHSTTGLRTLAGGSCRRIIAMSSWAFNHQKSFLEAHPDLRDVVTAKMTTLHPAQESLIASYDAKPLGGEVRRFTYVGRAFFLKGGMEVLLAFERLLGRGYPVHLTVVSDLECGDYLTRSTPDDQVRARSLMDRMGGACTYHASLPNAGVLQLLRESHAGLLPTLIDTYGYSVLESQAAGCPVITTDGCALPEINNSEVGWLIPVEKDPHGIARVRTPAERASFRENVVENLVRIVADICDRPGSLRQKGERALERIAREHSPESRAAILEDIYRQAAGGPAG
jgi:glycosyltransferase involved in cell wall biosynthesis